MYTKSIHQWGRVALIFVAATDDEPVSGARADLVFAFEDERPEGEIDIQPCESVLANVNAHLAAAWDRVVWLRELDHKARARMMATETDLMQRLADWTRQTRALAADVEQLADVETADAMRVAGSAAEHLTERVRHAASRMQACYVNVPADALGLCQLRWSAIHWARDQVRATLDAGLTRVRGVSRAHSVKNLVQGAGDAGISVPEEEAWTRAILRFPERIKPGQQDHVIADVLLMARHPPPQTAK